MTESIATIAPDWGDHAPIGTLLCAMGAKLRDAGIEDARHEARYLLAHHLGVPVSTLLLDRKRAVPTAGLAALLTRRLAREPLAFITGQCGFWTLDLHTDPATLIPRADTETLVEATLQARPNRSALRRVLDLGTGTGCLLLAILTEYPDAFGVGLDIAPAAARLARRNAAENGLASRAAFLAANWDAPLQGRFDLILSNPPYIPSAEIASLMPEVARFEPARALDGGTDGLDAYRRILETLGDRLAASGLAVLELGIHQAQPVTALAEQAGFQAHTRADLAGIPRTLVLQRGQ